MQAYLLSVTTPLVAKTLLLATNYVRIVSINFVGF